MLCVWNWKPTYIKSQNSLDSFLLLQLFMSSTHFWVFPCRLLIELILIAIHTVFILHTYGVDHSQNWMLEKINFHWHSFNLNISWSGPCFVYMLRVTHHEIDLIQYFNMHYFAASYVHTYVSVWILLCEDFLFTLFELANSDTNKFFYK